MSDNRITVNGQLFLGRIEEQKQFRAVLAEVLNTAPDEHLPYILLLYGDGGMGKSTLARRFVDIAQSEYRDQFQTLWIDWEDERRRSSKLQGEREHISAEDVFDVFYATVSRRGWGAQFAQYQDAFKARIEAEQKAAEALSQAGETDDLAELRGASATVIAKFIRTAVPVVGDAGENLLRSFADAGIKGGAEQLTRLRTLATNRLRARLDPDKFELFLTPHEHLAAALAEGLRKITASQPLITFLDTYEIVDRADIWLRMVLQRAGARLVWVIAGRDNLLRSRQFGEEYFKGYAEDFPRRLLAYDMRQLARDDIRDYFATYIPDRPLSEGDLESISRATRGIPLAVREAADIWKANLPLEEIVRDIPDGTPGEQIVRCMTERYQLHCISNETDRRALYVLALARGNVDLLRAMLHSDTDNRWGLDAELRRLERHYASVHRERARLHDEPADFFIEYLKSPLRRTEPWVQELIQRAIGTIRMRIDRMNASLPLIEDRCEDEDWIQEVLTLTEYLFWHDEELAWRWYIPHFVASLVYSTELRRGLLKIAHKWDAWLSRGGKKRLKKLRLADISTHSLEEEADLLEELTRLDLLGWLVGDGELERRSILNLRRGRLSYRTEQYDQALKYYEQVEQGLPENGEKLKRILSEYLGNLYGNMNRHEDAINAYQQVLALQPKANKAYSGIANIYWQLGQYEKAVESYKHAIEVDESDKERAVHYAGLGSIYRAMRLYEKSIPAYQKSIDLDPKYIYAYNGLGDVYRYQSRYDEAIAIYQQAIDLDPKYASPYSGLGNIYRYQSRYDEAIATYQQAIELNPKYAVPHDDLGDVYRDQGRYDEAITAYQQAIALNPKYVFPYNALGNIYRSQHRHDDAIAIYQQAISLDPKYPPPYNGLGIVYSNLSHYDEAISIYQQAIILDAKYIPPYNGLGDVYRELERYDEALAVYQKAISLDPKNKRAHGGLCKTYRDLGRYDEAIAACLHIISLDPKNITPYNILGNVYNSMGRYEEAINSFMQIINLEPNETLAHLSLASVYRKIGRNTEYEEQVAITRKLIDNQNEYNRACFEAICGDTDKAISLLRIALEKKQSGIAWMRRDPDLDFIRDDPRLIDLFGKLQ